MPVLVASPKDFAGKFRIELEPSMGPFAVAAGAEEWQFARGLNVLSKPPAAVGVPRAPAQVKVDGDLEDWAGVAPVPLPSHNGAPGWLKLCWTEAGLYGSVDVQDEDVSVDKGSLMSGDALLVSLGRAGATNPRGDADRGLADLCARTGPGAGACPCRAGRHVLVGERQGRGHRVRVGSDGARLHARVLPARCLPETGEHGGRREIAFECVILDDGEPSDSFYGVGGMAGMLRPASYGLLEFAP